MTNATSDTLPAIGDDAPDATLHNLNEQTVNLSSLLPTAETALAIVFLRHYGCSFCRQHALELQAHAADLEAAGIDVALVGCRTLKEANAFVTDLDIDLPLYNDPERQAYAAYGVGETSLGSIFRPSVIVSGVRALAQGHLPKKSSGDPKQLQGQFLIDRSGIVRTATRPASMSDIPPASDLLRDAAQLQRIP